MLPENKARTAGLRVGIVALVLTTLLCLIALANHEFDPLTFAHIGTRFSEHDPKGSVGYDGQFAYFIARDGAQAVPYMDGPTLRYQRILYPVLSRALALGNASLVPWTLILVNLAAQAFGSGMIAYLLKLRGVSPWYALVYSVWVGTLFAVRLDLNEPLFVALGLAGIIAYQKGHYRWTIFLLILSTMAKELGLIFAAGIALHAFLNHKRGWSVLIMGGPLLAFLAWWGVMYAWFGMLPTRYPAAKIQLPLQGMFSEENPIEFLFLAIWLGIPAVIICLLALRKLWRKPVVHLGTTLALTGAGFVLVMPDVSWQDPVAAYRVGISLIVTGLLFVAEAYPRRLLWLAALWLPTLLVILMTPTMW